MQLLLCFLRSRFSLSISQSLFTTWNVTCVTSPGWDVSFCCTFCLRLSLWVWPDSVFAFCVQLCPTGHPFLLQLSHNASRDRLKLTRFLCKWELLPYVDSEVYMPNFFPRGKDWNARKQNIPFEVKPWIRGEFPPLTHTTSSSQVMAFYSSSHAPQHIFTHNSQRSLIFHSPKAKKRTCYVAQEFINHSDDPCFTATKNKGRH